MIHQFMSRFCLTIALLFGVTAFTQATIAQTPTAPPPPAAPVPTATPAAPTSVSATSFECVRYQPSGFATIARRGDRVTSPIITWTSTLGGYSPEERCNIVSDRLTQAVAGVDEARLQNLRLTYGPVNGSVVICYVMVPREACQNSNLLMTLRPEDIGHEVEILQRLVNFGTQATGTPIDQNKEQYYAPLGEAIDMELGEPATPLNSPAPAQPTAPAVDSGF